MWKDIRFMFDYGALSCLWDNKEGSVLPLEDFPISKELLITLESLSFEFDSILNWDDPAAGFVWTTEQIENFRSRAKQAYKELIAQLGDEYKVENCIDLSLGIK